MNLIDKMNTMKFTISEQSVIDYLLLHQKDASTLTMKRIKEEAYTSNATIIRVCKKLGYTGYKEFLIQYIKEIESNKLITTSVDYDFPFKTNNTSDILTGIASMYKEAIDLCLQSLDLSQIEKMADYIIHSRRVFFLAAGDTRITTQSFINRLIKLNIYPIMMSDEFEYGITNIHSDDCVIFVSYSLSTKDYSRIFTSLNQKNVPVLIITANDTQAITRVTNCLVSIPNKESNSVEITSKVSTFYSQFMFQMIFNVLYSKIYTVLKVQ